MTTIKSLSIELLSYIFDSIDSTAQLAACRLVCRKWNAPAEKYMYGKKITIKSEKQAIVLHACLFNDARKGRRIKHLDFNIRVSYLPPIYHYLLELAFTPSIEQLTGAVQAKDFFTAIMIIADNTPEEFSQLKSLPKCSNTKIVLQAMNRLGIHSFTIGNDFDMSSAALLATLSHLTELEISGYNKEWKDLESILKHFPNLSVLKLVGFPLGRGLTPFLDVSNWLAAHVVKQMNLERLDIKDSSINAEIAEYLLFKYPNIKVTKCEGYNASGYAYGASSSLPRILDALRDLHVESATLSVPEASTIKWSLLFVKSRKERFEFEVDKDRYLVMKVKFTHK